MNRDPDGAWTSDALNRGDVDAIMRRVLDDPAYLASRDVVGDTPLQTAIAFHDSDLVGFMLRHGADPDPPVDDGYTCLLTAIESEDPASARIVFLLLAAGADVHRAGTRGWTPLHMAAARGHLEKAQLLLDAGAEVDRRKEIDAEETPLMEAAYGGHPEMVRLLLGRGADPTMRDTIHEHTPLQIAEAAAKGADPGVIEHIKGVDYRPILADILANLDIPPEVRAMARPMFAELDMAGQYQRAADQLARDGDHEGVIKVLAEYGNRS